MNTYVRRLTDEDAVAVTQLIDKVMNHRSMLKVYEPSEVTVWYSYYDLESVRTVISTCHAYGVFNRDTDQIVGSGYIKLTADGLSGHLGMCFTDYEVRSMGFGRTIIETLEQDEYAKSVGRLELGSSMSAFRFYRKLGYDCLGGEYQMRKECGTYSVPMEKFTRQ